MRKPETQLRVKFIQYILALSSSLPWRFGLRRSPAVAFGQTNLPILLDPRDKRLDKDVIFAHPGFLRCLIKFAQERQRKCAGEEPVWFSPQFARMVFGGAHVR